MRIPFRKDAFHTIPVLSQVIQVHGGVVWRADAVELVRKIPDESIDLVITDPAYESLEKWRSLGTTTRLSKSKGSSNKWFQTFPNNRYYELFIEFYRVLKPGSFLYMFCDEETRDLVCTGYSPQTDKYINTFEGRSVLGHGPLLSARFKYWKSLVWDKIFKGMGYHFPAQHEFIILAEKVKGSKHRRLNNNIFGDVIRATRLKGKSYYPTEKPPELIKILIEEACNEGDTVLDPFCGSGVVGQVCQDIKRKFILGDIDPDEAIGRLK